MTKYIIRFFGRRLKYSTLKIKMWGYCFELNFYYKRRVKLFNYAERKIKSH